MTAGFALNLVGTLVQAYAFLLAWLFIWASAHKLAPAAGARYAHVLTGYGLPGSALLARGIGLAELATGLLLLVPSLQRLGGVMAVFLLLAYSAGVAWQLLQGRRGADCGCAGPAGRLAIGPELLVRNLILLVLALGFCLSTPENLAAWPLVVPAAVVLIIVHLAVEQLLANAPQLRAVRR
jgi:uncharacterized membrane protein YphA (DoxX/SURF4 family)